MRSCAPASSSSATRMSMVHDSASSRPPSLARSTVATSYRGTPREPGDAQHLAECVFLCRAESSPRTWKGFCGRFAADEGLKGPAALPIPERRELLAAKMMGRWRSGAPLLRWLS